MNRKTVREMEREGYSFLAYSATCWTVNSYIARYRGRKIYGWYDWKSQSYQEESRR